MSSPAGLLAPPIANTVFANNRTPIAGDNNETAQIAITANAAIAPGRIIRPTTLPHNSIARVPIKYFPSSDLSKHVVPHRPLCTAILATQNDSTKSPLRFSYRARPFWSNSDRDHANVICAWSGSKHVRELSTPVGK